MPPNTTATITVLANPSQLPAGLRSAMGYLSSFAVGAKNLLSKINLAPAQMKKGNWVQHAVGQTVGNLATRGIDALVDQGRKVFDFNDQLVRFGIAAKISGAQLDFLGKQVRDVASATGMDAGEVLATARAYADLAGASNFTAEKMRILARAGQATGAEGQDLAQMMYQLSVSMKVADKDMENTIGGLIEQAKDGAVEARQMAREFGAIMPLWAKFGTLGREGTIQLGAMFQVIRDGYNTADEAGTGLQRLLAGLRTYAPRFAAHGVKVFDVDKNGFKHARDFSKIAQDIFKSDLVKDPALMKKAFGRTEAWRAVEMLFEVAKKGDKATAQFVARLAKLEEAGRKNGVVAQDVATYTESSAGRVQVAMRKMENSIADAFTPERIETFVRALEDISAKAGDIAEAFGKVMSVVALPYRAGKAIRAFLTPGESRVSAFSPSQIAAYANEHGMSKTDALSAMQADAAADLVFRKRMEKLMPDERATKESSKLAVETLMRTTSGGRTHDSALSYINEVKMTPQEQAAIWEEILKEEYRDATAKGTAFSSAAPTVTGTPQEFASMIGLELDNRIGRAAQEQAIASTERASEIAAAAAAKAAVEALQNWNPVPKIQVNSQLNLDGNPAARAVGNATDQRRR